MATENTSIINWKNLLITGLIAFIIFILLFPKSCGKDTDTVKITTTTDTVKKIDIKKVIDSAVNNALSKYKPEKQTFYFYKDRIIEPKDTIGLNLGSNPELLTLNTYKDTTKLKNAVIYSEIVSDGKVYANKVKAEVEEKTITNTITNTITKETNTKASGLFLSGGAGVGSGLGLDNVNAGLNYIYKNDIGIGIEGQYNFNVKQPVIGVKVFKRIF